MGETLGCMHKKCRGNVRMGAFEAPRMVTQRQAVTVNGALKLSNPKFKLRNLSNC
jgi:hypothetical protein